MSDNVIVIPVAELNALRVVCQGCGVATQAPLDQFARILALGDCPTCKKELLPTNSNGQQMLLKDLARVLKELAAAEAKVEFLLPKKD